MCFTLWHETTEIQETFKNILYSHFQRLSNVAFCTVHGHYTTLKCIIEI